MPIEAARTCGGRVAPASTTNSIRPIEPISRSSAASATDEVRFIPVVSSLWTRQRSAPACAGETRPSSSLSA
jgi:hypothetical protein